MSDFFKDKKIFITGHTGFKGSWLCEVLLRLNADVVGYAVEPPTAPALFDKLELHEKIRDYRGDIRDFESLYKVFEKEQPEIVIHMAAQPIVRESYKNPLYTYETNVIGTANILECIRKTSCVRSFLNVTTDKVYKNNEWSWGYRENDILDGFDPYSNSKSCSELVTNSYKQSFLKNMDIAVSTVRAGNVIGGGDFAKDRIIPDCIRAVKENNEIIVRNPYSTRPYQHVLEPLFAYLLIVKKQYEDISYAGSYNIGPDECDCFTTGDLVDLFCEKWKDGARWKDQSDNGPHEAGFLKLDCSKIKGIFGWKPTWHIEETMEKICEWSKADIAGCDIKSITEKQINEFLRDMTWKL